MGDQVAVAFLVPLLLNGEPLPLEGSCEKTGARSGLPAKRRRHRARSTHTLVSVRPALPGARSSHSSAFFNSGTLETRRFRAFKVVVRLGVAVVHVDDTVALRSLLEEMWHAAPGEISTTQTELVLEQY